MAYNKYIALGGKADGKLFPRTPAGLEQAKATDAKLIRPAQSVTEDQAESWDDWNDYGVDIDRGNSAAYVKP
jgi:hypothetical protein